MNSEMFCTKMNLHVQQNQDGNVSRRKRKDGEEKATRGIMLYYHRLCTVSFLFILIVFDLRLVQAQLQAQTQEKRPSVFGTVSKKASDIKFYLYPNPDDEDERREIVFEDRESLFHSGYNASLPVTILMHGALSNSLTFTDVRQIKDAYLRERYPTNVVMVDYGLLTQSGLPFAVSTLSVMTAFFSLFNTQRITHRVSDFIIFLMKCHVLKGPQNVHLIGFSLSGMLVGLIGKNIRHLTGKKIRRISGLDPMPYLALLDKSDAEFVDITLTNFGVVPPFIPPIVHSQFYINRGGRHQPNCPNLWPFVETYCSHSTSVFYYAKSIRKKPIACRCNKKRDPVENCFDKTIYGEHLPSTSRGNFCLRLN